MTDDVSSSRVVSSVRLGDDDQFEAGLRPRTLDAYIGQERLRENLDVSITATRQRGEALDHVLLYGPPGLGKTLWRMSSPMSSACRSGRPPGPYSRSRATWPRF